MNIKQFNNYTNDNDMEIKLTHPNIVDFYHQYPHIDCEFVNLSIINIIKPFLNDSKLEKDTSLIEKYFPNLLLWKILCNQMILIKIILVK